MSSQAEVQTPEARYKLETKKNAEPSTEKATSVIDYIVQRLADEGITDCFGVPGDYAFPVCDAVDRNPNIRWVGCSNELNASYAADGYARVRGAAMLSTTYAVGELSAINGVMGAKAERSLVYHVVGMPSYQNQRVHKILHHTFGDGVFGNFVNISAQAACCHAVINPDNCMIEMERVITEARRNNQPAYIVVPGDYALAPVTPTEVRPVTLKSNEASLEKAVAAIAERVRGAKSIVAFPAFTLARLRLQKEARRRSRRWAARSLPRQWKSASSTKATRNLPGCMRERCPQRRRGRLSRTRNWCLISAGSASMTKPPRASLGDLIPRGSSRSG